MPKQRLELFSDAVLAIVITVMLLEIKPPDGGDWGSLEPLLPVFLSYVLSFANVAIFWNNHGRLLRTAEQVGRSAVGWNLLWLFWISLLPFATAWMDDQLYRPAPVALYGLVLLGVSLSHNRLARALHHPHEREAVLKTVGRQRVKGLLSLAAYLVAVALAYRHTGFALGIYAAVALAWLLPEE